jgi:hypothetical protein
MNTGERVLESPYTYKPEGAHFIIFNGNGLPIGSAFDEARAVMITRALNQHDALITLAQKVSINALSELRQPRADLVEIADTILEGGARS